MKSPATPPAVAAGGGRRKGTTSRAWLVISDSGSVNLEEVGKHSIMRRTGLPARDLRVLDPMLSYLSTILGQERAIIINLEHIKAVITAIETTDYVDGGREATTKINLSGKMQKGSPGSPLDVGKDGGAKVLPFEFRALEVCLEPTCKCLESEWDESMHDI